MPGNLIVILGDQLSHSLSSLCDIDKKHDRVLMMEVIDENTYVPHHQQKIVFVLSCMRHFASELQQQKITVDYIQLDDKASKASFTETLKQYCKDKNFNKIIITFPGEYRVLADINNWEKTVGISVELRNDDRFFCDIDDFKAWIQDKKQPRMEHFYQRMRKQTGYLMQGNKPIGGKWNYDKDNRKPPSTDLHFPKRQTHRLDNITKEVIALVKERFAKHFGEIEPFNYAVTAKQAEKALQFFIEHCLEQFGPYQDAMVNDEFFLFHSMLSPYLNIGLLTAKQVCEAVLVAHKQEKYPLNSVEGFIRQILGWREYVRGLYWTYMPEYKKRNALGAKRPLPDFYWTGKTDMACIKHCVQQTQAIAHSHHIQRLMITGNFALLCDIDIMAICDWYLAVYVDAYEWVELPNTLGMVMYADGGLLASKPYIASGNYINKMSNFCDNCQYKVKDKLGPSACPFNYLYWDFLIRHKKLLEKNMRLRYPYNTLSKMSAEKITAIQQQATAFLKDL